MCLADGKSITLFSRTRDSTLRIKIISQIDNKFNNSANIIEHLGTMGDFKMHTRIPAFKEFYSLVGGIEEHQQEHRITGTQGHNGISATYAVFLESGGGSPETNVAFSCGKSEESP